ncbi:MAG: hypothetical protein EOO51_00650 [Flavobacterium sp.]|nr:MAG: hypothetical protein EOO51_00650 [Flavobacterium sp.]
MINPSVHGWIDKLLLRHVAVREIPSADTFYRNVRQSGFIYGHIIAYYPLTIKGRGLMRDESSKVALLNTLFGIYSITRQDTSTENFVASAVEFYSQMNPQGFRLFKKIFTSATASHRLENIIDERVRTNHDMVSRNFSHIVTNALLFVDVLAFRKYLIDGEITDKYLKKTEESIISLLTLALKTKTVKSAHDDQLIRLFEASVRYTKFSRSGDISLENLKLDFFKDDLEKYYLTDLAGMALWSDGVIENEEAYFLYKLGEKLGIDDAFVTESMQATNDFISTHKSEIHYFNYSNPVRHFYDNMTQNVIVLIKRNRNRLVREIMESKELMVLLAHSTRRDLDAKEKKKVKTQLLDICKTIPSLTIFLLPGGSLLLPILIKFIPTMLPSAFNENTEVE